MHAADPDRPFAAQAASSASVPFPRRLAARFGAASATREVPWERPALALVLLIAAFLDIFRLSQEGYGNTYYAAAVRSMLQSWHNFLFVSFDPGGFVTIDKPPAGFWLQTLSAKLFGYHGITLILPQAIAGVLSVALLYVLVRRVFGPVAGLLAALALAVTPINVATNRDNTVDTLLALTALAAAWAVLRAVETGRLRWLILSMALVGLGFNIKMLEAYLVLPAIYIVYFIASRLRWRTRIWHLAAATAVLLVISFSWAVAVDLTPAADRPYVGSSQDNSELNLIFGYNGLNRVLPRGGLHIFGLTLNPTSRVPGAPAGTTAPRATAAPRGGGGGFGGDNGGRSWLRLIGSELGGQLGWLVPLALLGLLAAAWQTRPVWPFDRRQASILFWGAWLLTVGAFFSYTSTVHVYYTVMLTPAIAACAGFGFVALWRDYRSGSWRGWLLPATVVATAAVQIHILADYPTWRARLEPAIIALTAVATVGLVIGLLARPADLARLVRWPELRRTSLRLPVALAAAGALALLIAPTAWAGYTTLDVNSGMAPSAGPAQGDFGRIPAQYARYADEFRDRPAGANNAYRGGNFLEDGAALDPQLLSFLESHRGNARYLVATPNAMTAAPIVIATGQPVMALGGFSGSDPILTTSDLEHLVANGTVRYFLMGGRGGFGGFGGFPGGGGSTDQAGTAHTQSGANPGSFGGFGQTSGDRTTRGGESAAGTAGERPDVQRGGFGGFGFIDQNTTWVSDNCTAVPSSEWQPAAAGGSGLGSYETLYDCAGATTQGG